MIDWHCHVLPGMDDGSRDVTESIALMKMQASQGIDTVIATPHFYANDETAASFLDRRERSLHILKAELTDDLPKIIPGAEVKYYQGISRMETLKDLRISGTKMMLLEMPMTEWSGYMINELLELSGKSSFQIVLAHIDRYFSFQKRGIWHMLSANGIFMQINADCFDTFMSKRKALSFLEDGIVQFVGSDCHSVKSRPPEIGKAYDVIRGKFGEEYVCQMDEYGHSMLGENN